MKDISSVWIIWLGSFGSFVKLLIEKHAPKMKILTYELTDNTSDTLQDCCACDLVIPCVPIAKYLETLDSMSHHLWKWSIIIDICTLKVMTLKHLESLWPDVLYLSTHPLFWPNSYIKNNDSCAWFTLAVCGANLPDEQQELLLSFGRQIGCKILQVSADKHDKDLANSLFLTHYLSQIIADAWFDRTPVDTASFWYLMDIMEIVQENTKLFQDVYTFNPYCKEMVEKFRKSEERVTDFLTQG